MGIGTLIKQNRLAVPSNQREYAWDVQEVTSLLQDFDGAITQSKSYFLGTILLTQSVDGATRPLVADGQQRLATTTILLASIRDYYCNIEEEDLADSIETDFLSEFDRPSKEDVPKLRLNVDDREFFRKRVLCRPNDKERIEESAKSLEELRPSHQKIAQAANLCAEYVAQKTDGQKKQNALARLEEITEFILNSVRVITLVAPDDFSAFIMFETMNDRGVKTTQFDLLKNHLFDMARDRLDEVQHKWARMVAILESGDEPALDYLRYLLIIEYGPTQEKEIMERVRKNIGSRRIAIEFVDKLLDHAQDFVAVFSPETHAKWGDYGANARRHLATIQQDLKVEQIMPLIMAVSNRFSIREAKKAFRLFVSWSVRFLISGGRGGLLDKHYSQKAHLVGQGEIRTAEELTASLMDILPPNGAFHSKFLTATISRGYWARYYLRALELQVKGDPEPELVPNPSEEIITLEHVLPQNPCDDWFIDEEVAIGQYRRLGNLALLQSTSNGEIGNSAFNIKKKAYRNSAFYLTSMIAKEREWGPKQIAKRQKLLADLAVETWPLEFRK